MVGWIKVYAEFTGEELLHEAFFEFVKIVPF
jgi:hypothetical protein